MLHKDEYNQEEYDKYYAQETRGAEISSRRYDDEGGGKKMLFIVLLLGIIGVGGYFGFKSINFSDKTIISDSSQKSNSSNIKKKNGDEISQISDKEKISKKVKSVISVNDNSNGKMNPEDIANIVQMVMQKMSEEKSRENDLNQNSKPTKEQVQDNRLEKKLTNTEVDSSVSELEKVDIFSEEDKSKKATTSDVTDTYNKIVVDEKEVDRADELSKLSDEISNVIAKDTKQYTSEYVDSVTKEVKARKKEMRYITVRKGDTLGKIAKRVYGNVMDYKKIYEANPDILRRPDRIYIGQRLRVPE